MAKRFGIIKRVPKVSQEAKDLLKATGKKRRTIVSFFPVDKYGCDCFEMVQEYKEKFASLTPSTKKAEMKRMGMIVCPRAKQKGYKKYEIKCNVCSDTVAVVHAKDKKLTDWCNLHYICSHDKNKWRGCFTVNTLGDVPGFECACGNDTRKPNMKERKFGENYSLFRAVQSRGVIYG